MKWTMHGAGKPPSGAVPKNVETAIDKLSLRTHSKVPVVRSQPLKPNPQEPKICPTYPNIQGKGEGIYAQSSEVSERPQSSSAQRMTSQEMIVRVERGWCMPLQPPNTMQKSFQSQKAQPVAPPKPPSVIHLTQASKTPPKAPRKGWDTSRMFRPNKRSKWAKLTPEMKEYGGPSATGKKQESN